MKKTNLVKKALLILMTKMQEITIKSENLDLYYKVTKLHFKLYFGKSLVESAIENNIQFKRAARRHLSMVNILVFDRDTPECFRNSKMIQNTFRDNLIIEASMV